MINGVMIDLDPDVLSTSRTCYGLDDFAQEVGGFIAGVAILISFAF